MAPTSATRFRRWSALGAETWNVMPDLALAVGTSMSPEKYQSNTSPTPSFASATYPSRDIDMIAITLVMVQPLSVPQRLRGRGVCDVSLVVQTRVPPESHRSRSIGGLRRDRGSLTCASVLSLDAASS